MNTIVVDIADMRVAEGPDSMLVTYSLGSCLGITVYDPVRKLGGMIHCMLPVSSVDRSKAASKPCMFVDTGVALLFKTLFEMGLQKKDAVVKVAGGAMVLDKQGLFRIGERNHTIFRKLMWKNGMMIGAEDVGGQVSRTMKLYLDTGRVTIRSAGEERDL